MSRLNSVSRLDSAGSEFEREILASPREVTDPGHVTASLNCATGGRVVSGSGQPMKRFEFTIETSVGPSIFHRTKVSIPRLSLFGQGRLPVLSSSNFYCSQAKINVDAAHEFADLRHSIAASLPSTPAALISG